jgi:hypothetical protein
MNTIEDCCLAYYNDIETQSEDVVISIFWKLLEWHRNPNWWELRVKNRLYSCDSWRKKKQWISKLTYHLGVFILSSTECWRIVRWRPIEEVRKGFEEICKFA